MMLAQTHGVSKLEKKKKLYKTKQNKQKNFTLGCGPAQPVESELNILYGLQLRNASLFLVS